MLEQVLSDITRRQRPYYLPTENPIKGLNNQYWLVFKHRDTENLLHNIVNFLGLGEKHSTYKIIRLDLNDASLYEYIPKKEGNIPNSLLLRTRKSSDVEKFLDCINSTTEKGLFAGSFLEIIIRKRRRFNLPSDRTVYDGNEDEEDEEDETEEAIQEKRQQLRKSIEKATDDLKNNPEKAREIYNLLLEHCELDLTRLANIEGLLKREFVKDHKRLQVMQKVAELVTQGNKVLLISVFSDTVIDYYRYMQNNSVIAQAGIGMAIGGTKQYLVDAQPITVSPHNVFYC